MARKRLTREDWIKAALKGLAKTGPAAIAVEPLARDMKTTKGSFYWHFKDLPELRSEVAQEWKRRAAGDLVATLEDPDPHAEKLRGIARPSGSTALEPAMRAWARSSKEAAGAVAEIDRLRLDATHALLRETGISNPDIARALYAAAIGLETIGGATQAEKSQAMTEIVDLVLALR